MLPAGFAAACGAEAGVGGQPLHRGTLLVHTLLVLKHGGLQVPLFHEQLLQHLLLLRHQRVQRSDLLASAAAAAAAALALASERQLLRSERSPVGAWLGVRGRVRVRVRVRVRGRVRGLGLAVGARG